MKKGKKKKREGQGKQRGRSKKAITEKPHGF